MNKAGFGTRVLNFIIDTLLIFGIAYIVNNLWDVQVMYWHYPFIPFYGIFWIIMFVYYMFFEMIFKRSPAKWLTFSKVVNKDGKRPAFWQIMVRSLIRLTIIDCFFIPFLDKPLHDYLSKTDVVQA
ncbi:MAG: RDD family protein [Parafilimonas sp.]|nr:RDD family protein [Parafilimonas sp.]